MTLFHKIARFLTRLKDTRRVFLVNSPDHHAWVGRERMFNIVKRRNFVLADDLRSMQEAKQLLEKCGRDYIVVIRADT